MCGEQAAGREAGRDFKATMEGRTAQKTELKSIYILSPRGLTTSAWTLPLAFSLGGRQFLGCLGSRSIQIEAHWCPFLGTLS